jgi:MoxR-vWA-beta-propeller ternary system domain bpX2/FtsH ternary system domain X7
MNAWAACIDRADCHELAGLRLFAGAECAAVGGIVWLRGSDSSEDLERALAKVPGLERFELLLSGRLKARHSRIPGGILPPASWRPLKEMLVPVLPSAALAGQTRQKLALTLRRSRQEQTPAALITNLAAWTEFASQAPSIRLERLVFAVAEDRQTLVLAEPLPALPGLRLTNQTGVLTPCGYAWSPTVEPAALRELFGLAPDDVAILAPDGTHQVVRAEQFVRASRSAARATAAGFDRGRA